MPAPPAGIAAEVPSNIDAMQAKLEVVRARIARADDMAVVDELYRTFDGFSDRQIYNHLPDALTARVALLRASIPQGAARVLRLLVLHALSRSLVRLSRGEQLPAALVPTALKTLALVLRAVETESDDRYSVHDDRYVKDLHVARLRLLPLGAQLVDPYQGYSRKPFLLGGGLLRLPVAVLAMLRHGGNAPWHEFHTYDLGMRFFSAKGWEDAVRLCAPLLHAQPEVRGVFGAAWWFDPQVAKLTPNMAFPYEVSARLGAQFFPLPVDEESRHLAVYRSPERAALVESGRYTPQPFLMLLPRAALLANT